MNGSSTGDPGRRGKGSHGSPGYLLTDCIAAAALLCLGAAVAAGGLADIGVLNTARQRMMGEVFASHTQAVELVLGGGKAAADVP